MPQAACRGGCSSCGRLLTAQPPCRLPLGVPSQLVLTAMDLAGRLIGVPQSKAAAAQVPSSMLQSSIQTAEQLDVGIDT